MFRIVHGRRSRPGQCYAWPATLPGNKRSPPARWARNDRAHRIGQTKNVMVYRLVAEDTIEEKVMALKARKARLFSSVLDDGNAFGTAVNADDIRALLA